MFPLLRKRSRATVALDIGSNIVKCLRIDHTGERPLVTNFAMVDLLPEAIVEGEIMDRDMVIEAVRECLSRAGIQDETVVSAVSGRSVIVKKIIMDKMAAEDAQEAILWEAEQHVPFDIDDICLDFQILRDDVGANQMEILLVAAKKETIQGHAELLREAGLRPVVIDVDAFAVQNCFESLRGGPSSEVVGLLNIGADVTSVCIVQGGIPYFTRDLAVGTNRFVEELQREFGLGHDDARRLAAHPDDQQEVDADRLVDVVQEVAEDLSTGIERSLSFLRTAGDAETIDRIVLSGGGSRFPGLAEFLKHRHDIEVEHADPLEGVEFDPEVFENHDVDRISPLLAVSVGLGMRTPGDKQ
jgi:type IV pilus assembly protein PilM